MPDLRRRLALLILSAALFAGMATTTAGEVVTPPSAADALAAWEAFRAAPVERLDRTPPFLDYIRRGGAVHIVLNENLLGWMHDALEDEVKAVLYAAFLGGNMAAQLARGSAGSDDIAGMTSALDAYRALRAARPALHVALFDDLDAAANAGHLEARIVELAGAKP